jgi:hypothetical protein
MSNSQSTDVISRADVEQLVCEKLFEILTTGIFLLMNLGNEHLQVLRQMRAAPSSSSDLESKPEPDLEPAIEPKVETKDGFEEEDEEDDTQLLREMPQDSEDEESEEERFEEVQEVEDVDDDSDGAQSSWLTTITAKHKHVHVQKRFGAEVEVTMEDNVKTEYENENCEKETVSAPKRRGRKPANPNLTEEEKKEKAREYQRQYRAKRLAEQKSGIERPKNRRSKKVDAPPMDVDVAPEEPSAKRTGPIVKTVHYEPKTPAEPIITYVPDISLDV